MRLLVCVLCYITVHTVSCANILGLFPTIANSAFSFSEAIMKGLALRGHNVTVVSCFPQKHSVTNYTDVSIRDFREIIVSRLDFKQYAFPYSLFDMMTIFQDDIIGSMDKILRSDQILNLISANVTFGVVFYEVYADDVFLMLARKFKAPIITVGPSYILPWTADRFAIPQNPAYIPVLGNEYDNHMDFRERLVNTISVVMNQISYWYRLVPKSIETYRKCFNDLIPSVPEAARDISMYFVNTHFTILGARPYPPQVVEIGGIHVQPAKPLSKELAEWMDGASFGVIYFSFGSMLRGATLPADKVEAFLEVFRRIPQRIVWKWEDDALEGISSNVKIMKWLPQRDVLGHPKTKLFISHGGLLGSTEAVVSGVPILGIPIYLDQANNVAILEDAGVAILLNYNNITVENLYYAVNQLLTNAVYSDNAKSLARRFFDRPQSPVETAVYWTEYVIRHSGATHLKSAALQLTWYQYYLLDIAAVVLTALIAIIPIVYYSVRSCVRVICSRNATKIKSN